MAAPTFYLLHGEDDFSREEEIAGLRARLSEGTDPTVAAMNTALFDSPPSLDEIKNACEALPFMAERRLVVARGMVSAAKGGAQKALAAYLPTLPDWARLLLVENKTLSNRHAIVRLAREHARGYEKAFTPPRNTTGWIRRRAAEHQAEITPAAAAALAEATGDDLRAADNELCKLAAYADGTRPIDVDDIIELTPYVPEANIFEMVDALVAGDGKGATTRLHRLLEKQAPLSILGMVARQFRLLLMAKTYLEGGGTPGGLAEAIDVHPYAARKLPGQARSFSMAQLEAIYRRLLDYDVQIKTGRIDPELALDLLAAALAR